VRRNATNPLKLTGARSQVGCGALPGTATSLVNAQDEVGFVIRPAQM